MNLSQFCNIVLFSKPAARHTNKDRLLYCTTSTSGGRFAPRASAGITLVEVLVAMVILLVGIWTVAVSFPKLLGVVATQEKRTEMARQAERTLTQLTRYPDDLPLAIRGDTFNLGPAGAAAIDATSQPEDPTITDFAITRPNARDDIIEVIGERFTVPGPTTPPFGSLPVHIFRQGLAEPGATVVYQIFKATTGAPKPSEARISITSAGFVDIVDGPATAYIADPNPVAITGWYAYVSYAWVYDGHDPATDPVQYVNGEEVVDGGQVLAGALGHNIVEGSLTGEVRAYYHLATAVIAQDDTGAVLTFPPNFVGAQMGVNYTLRTAPTRNGRRALIMSEEHRIVSLPQTITLVASHIDDEVPLPVGLAADTHVLAVDVNTGQVYWEYPDGDDGLRVTTKELDGTDGWSQGTIVVTRFVLLEPEENPNLGEYAVPETAIGHDFRFYYVTLDQDLISVQIAPATFVDWNIADAAGDDSLFYRSYLAERDGGTGEYTGLLFFYPCNAGHTVTVDYEWYNGTTTKTAHHEMHTISTEPGNHYITLNWPNVTEISAVTGESLHAIAWWQAPNGRLIRLDIARLRR